MSKETNYNHAKRLIYAYHNFISGSRYSTTYNEIFDGLERVKYEDYNFIARLINVHNPETLIDECQLSDHSIQLLLLDNDIIMVREINGDDKIKSHRYQTDDVYLTQDVIDCVIAKICAIIKAEYNLELKPNSKPSP